MRKSIYYAHSMKLYNSEQEKQELEYLESIFRDVLCPNRDIKKLCNLVGHDHKNIKGMEPFLKYIERHTVLTIVSEYLGFIGKGVYEEIMKSRRIKIPSLLVREFKIFRIRNIILNDTKDWAVKYAKIDAV